ncbi:pyridoxal phosphate-dependent aminotransferase [Tumebacillus sp. DT12]|uniref:Aminotransferase n=1 Tax=Tumebacillus lacus TaxID=2995335 RepID=A0ABT3X4K1_9BACL|nr:pyridoxal phosphate-dependent aminotransferase [Tumebacillus lacus]MCX7569659.1 pyridoxal phosphate-dependent aminotransferase [Tumebacillus lacus]
MSFGLSERVKNIAPSPTLSIDTKTKAMMAEGIDVINLSVGEPDFGTPEIATEAGKAAIDAQFTKYTAVPGIVELRNKIAAKLNEWHGLDYTADDILVSSGAKHSLYNAFMALCNPGDEVILPAPYWVSYPEMIALAEATPVVIATDESTGFKITPEQLQQAITPKTKVLLLNSPSNPTGAVYTKEELAALAEVITGHEFYVISDEIYDQLVYDVEQVSIATFPGMKERTILINGFSKAYSMTGWRVGYLAGDRAAVKAMTSFQSHTTANPASISQKAALAALDHIDEAMVPEFRWRRDYVLERLAAMPHVSCDTPDGAFYVFPNCAATFGKSYQGHRIEKSDDFAALLLEYAKISLVPGTGFGAPNNFRISYATSRDNLAKAMDRLEAFLKELV